MLSGPVQPAVAERSSRNQNFNSKRGSKKALFLLYLDKELLPGLPPNQQGGAIRAALSGTYPGRATAGAPWGDSNESRFLIGVSNSTDVHRRRAHLYIIHIHAPPLITYDLKLVHISHRYCDRELWTRLRNCDFGPF